MANNGTNIFAFDATRNRLLVGRRASQTVSVLFFNTDVIADGAINNPAIYSSGLPNALVNAIIPNGRTVSLSGISNIGLVSVNCTATLTGASAANYVVGSVRKNFCAAANESFIYPLGDANVYTPLTVLNTNGTGALTASATDNFLTGLPQAKSLSRYWSLTGAGITTNLTFSYTDADVNGMESAYNVYKRSGATNLTTAVSPSSVNAAANTFTATNVSQFSDWSAGDTSFAPTAAGVSISGRVSLPGRNPSGAIVYLTTTDGETLQTDASWEGEYQFDGIAAGQTVISKVFAKRYRFAPQIISVTEDVTEVNFAPLP